MIKIVEVGPRDGLQNEPVIINITQRIELIDRLTECGFSEIEVGSFVSPKQLPQMANTNEVFLGIKQKSNIRYSALVPNQKGFDAAIASDFKNISVFTATTDAFNLKNINCTVQESLARYSPIVTTAVNQGIRVRGYISCITHCPYTGKINPDVTIHVAASLMDLGCAEISLGETLGTAYPEEVDALLSVLTNHLPIEQLALHCHDTYGRALDNIKVGLEHGITTFDSAINGLGGCPFAGGKTKGNVATEKLVDLFNKLEYKHSIDQDKLLEASAFASKLFYEK